jgi:dienelactone hydrolase
LINYDFDDASPHYAPRGWTQWPENEDFSFQFMRVLGAAQEGGSTVSECFLAASRIDSGDEDSWYREWKTVADSNKERGDLALSRGHKRTAQSNWLRATTYYRTAEIYLKSTDLRQAAVLERMEECARLYLRHAFPAGEVVEISCSPTRSLRGYFLPASGPWLRAPVVVCIGGAGHLKTEHLWKLPRYARDRGLSLLLVDLPAQASSQSIAQIGRQPDGETCLSHCVDYLTARCDVDASRIAIFGDGMGSSLATRTAGLDHRLAAAVCDAGVWDLHERAFLVGRMCSSSSRRSIERNIETLACQNMASNIKCPILVTVGEHDWLDFRHVKSVCDVLEKNGLNIELKVFGASETGAAHGQIDNPTMGSEFIFDWISDRLRAAA